MTLLEAIVRELAPAPEPLLLQVLDLIQSAKSCSTSAAHSSSAPRTSGLHQGQM